MRWGILAILFLHVSGHALDPRWSYRVLDTEHFEVLFREDQRTLAKRYAIAAEQAHTLLMPIFKEGPARTIIVLQDDTDFANGLADFLPYPHIIVYPVLPTQGDLIDEYGDWAFEMIVHEYTHILNMYPAHGFYWPLKYFFGSVVRPNAVLPRWYLEGLAVNLESRLSDFGRLRSVQTQAVARAYSLGDKFKTEDIATVNESETKTFPYGARPYLFGAWWWDEAHRQKGADGIYTLNQNYSRRLPFFINGPMREQYGLSAQELLVKAGNAQAGLAARQIETIRAAGASAGEILDNSGDAGAFAVSPSGQKLIYALGLREQGSYFFLRDRAASPASFATVQAEKLFRTVGTYRVSWRDDQSFVFDQARAEAPYTKYRDLFLYDLKARKTEALTVGARAQEPAVSPDGKLVACIQNDGGRNALSIYDFASKSLKKIVQGNYWNRLASPEFLDADQILFTVRARKGEERLYVHNLKTHKSQVWNAELKSAQGLRRTPVGLLTTDAASGARNVFRFENGRPIPVTNTLTQIQNADYDPATKSLLIQEMTPDGQRLKTLPLQTRRPAKIEKPSIEAPPPQPAAKFAMSERGFWPIEYLRPRYWIPMLYPVEGGIIAQGVTGGEDPLERNLYQLAGSFDSITKKASYVVGYENRSLPVGIGGSYSDFVTYLGASGRLIESKDADLHFGGHLGSRFTGWSLGGLWSQTEGSRADYRRIGPQVGVAYHGLDSPYNQRFAWEVELAHQQFLDQDGYLAYGHSYAHITNVISLGRHKVALQLRGAVAPDLPFGFSPDLGDRSVGGNYLINLANSQFLLRGYPSGAFVGRKIINGNLEWVMPGAEIARGFGTFPLFLRSLDLAVFADTLAVDGGAFDPEALGYFRSRLSEFYTGTGTELRFRTTAAYHLPIQFTLGLYYGLKDQYGGGFTPFLAVGLGSLDPISKKTP